MDVFRQEVSDLWISQYDPATRIDADLFRINGIPLPARHRRVWLVFGRAGDPIRPLTRPDQAVGL